MDRFHERLSKQPSKLDTLGFSLTQPSSSPPSPPASLMMKHTTPLVFLIVCAFPFHYCWRLWIGLLCERTNNGFHLMGLFIIGKIALKRESRRDSDSKRSDCEAILSWGVWHPPYLFLAICQALLYLRVALEFCYSFCTMPQSSGSVVWLISAVRILRYINSSDFFDQVTQGDPFPWPTFSDD